MPRVTRKVQGPQPVQRGRKFRLRISYFILLGLMGLFAFSFIQKTREIQRLRAEKVALQYQNQKIQSDNSRIQHSLGYLRTTDYVQNAARAVFGYTLPGEYAIMSKPNPAPVVAMRAAPPRPALPPQPTWKQWWQSFFG